MDEVELLVDSYTILWTFVNNWLALPKVFFRSAYTVLYGSWFDNVLSWWKHKDDSSILFLKYEEMKKVIKSMHNKGVFHFVMNQN